MPDLFKEHQRIKSCRYRGKKAGVENTLTLAEWIGILEHFGSKCAYCQTKEFDVIDHITALKHGGGNVATNVVPACHDCNAQKDRKGQRRDHEKIARVTGQLHTFLNDHGPFTPIEEEALRTKTRVQTLYHVVSDEDYARMKAMGRNVVQVSLETILKNIDASIARSKTTQGE